MKKRTILMGLLLAAILVFTGCSQRMLDFSIISTKNVMVPLSGKGERTEGSSWSHWFLIIPVNFRMSPSLEDAVDEAIEVAGPEYDALMDGVVYNKGYSYIVGWGSGFVVEGTPVNTQVVQSSNPELLDRIISHSTADETYREVSEENLEKLSRSIPDL